MIAKDAKETGPRRRSQDMSEGWAVGNSTHYR